MNERIFNANCIHLWAVSSQFALKFLITNSRWVCSSSSHLHWVYHIFMLNLITTKSFFLTRFHSVDCHLHLRLVISSKTIHKCLHVFREHKIMKWELTSSFTAHESEWFLLCGDICNNKAKRKARKYVFFGVFVLRCVCGNGISISSKTFY